MKKIAMAIADTENWFKDLEELKIKNTADLEDTKNFHATSMISFSIINAAISIGEETIAIKRLGFPSSYREIFQLLEKNKAITKQTAKDLTELAVYRNMFAHQYWSFDKKDVWRAIKKLHTVKSFIKQIQKALGEKK